MLGVQHLDLLKPVARRFVAGRAPRVPGFHTREVLAERYLQRTGRDLSGLNFYVGFNWWKSPCIVHGAYARHCAGKKSTEGVDMEGLRERIGRYLALSQRALG